MLGVFVNMIAILAGGLLGLLIQKIITQECSDFVMKGVGLCTVYIGMEGALEGNHMLIAVLSMAIGAMIGHALRLDDHLNRLSCWVEKKCNKDGGKTSLAQGFTTATLLFCIGSMATVGSLRAGMGDYEMIYMKAMVDGVSAFVLTSSMGPGILLSCVMVLFVEGGITLFAGVLSPILTEGMVAEITCVGSLSIIGIGLNLLGITKLKIINFMPSIFLAMGLYVVYQLF